jgi:hypothetical protein
MHPLRTAALALALVASAGCYHAVINTALQPSGQVIEEPWAMSFAWGLVPPDIMETAAKCPGGVAKVETVHSFMNGLVNVLTFGIVSPMSIRATCAAGARRSSDEANLTIDPETPLQSQREQLTRALRAAGDVNAILVRFE